jgi:hypothetical protein
MLHEIIMARHRVVASLLGAAAGVLGKSRGGVSRRSYVLQHLGPTSCFSSDSNANAGDGAEDDGMVRSTVLC